MVNVVPQLELMTCIYTLGASNYSQNKCVAMESGMLTLTVVAQWPDKRSITCAVTCPTQDLTLPCFTPLTDSVAMSKTAMPTHHHSAMLLLSILHLFINKMTYDLTFGTMENC